MSSVLFRATHLALAVFLVVAPALFVKGWRHHRAASLLGLVGCLLFALYHALVTVVSGVWFSWSNGKPDNAVADWVVLTVGPLQTHWVPLSVTAFMLAALVDRGPLGAFLTSTGWTASRRPLAWATVGLASYFVGMALGVVVAPYRRGFLDPLPAPAELAATIGYVLRNWIAVVLMAYAALAGRSAFYAEPRPASASALGNL